MKPVRILGKIFIILLVLTLISCEENLFQDYADDSSADAKLEQALIYLDEGKYSSAKDILETLDTSDEEVKRALASAYAGMAGLEVPTLIAALDDTSGNTGLEAVGKVLGDTDNNNELTGTEIDNKITDINNAISQYEGLTLDSSVKAQLCILYATRIVLYIGDAIGGTVPLDETIRTDVAHDAATFSAANPNSSQNFFEDIDDDIQKIDQYIDDIDAALGTGNSLREGFDEFISDLDRDSNGSISAADINNFLDTINTL